MTSPNSLTAPGGTSTAEVSNRSALEARWRRRFPRIESSAVRHRPEQPGVVEILGASGHWVSLHSARHPEREASRWLDEALAGRSLPSAVCVIGAGLGYVLDVIEAWAPSTRVLVLEPEPGLVSSLLSRRDWRPLIEPGRLLVLAGPEFDGASEAWKLLDGEEEPLILSHAVLARERPDASMAAARVVQRAKRDWTANREARRQLGGQYVRNTLLNLTQFERAGDVARLTGLCPGVPAIVAAAGPSLNRNLDELSAIGNVKDRAVVICADTALRPCLAAGFAPDFAVAVDASAANARHLTNLPDTQGTWLVAESSVDPSAFEAFDDRVLLLRVGDHDPWPFLHSLGIDRGTLSVWGSVLTAAADLALRMGCDPVIFVGADLAYSNGQPYCWGTVYDADWAYAQSQGHVLEELWRTHWMKEPAIHVTGVEGRQTRTAAHLVAFRDWLVELSNSRSPRRFINATGAGVLQGGAFSQLSAADALAACAPDGRRPRRSAWALRSARPASMAHLSERLLAAGTSGLESEEAQSPADGAAGTLTTALVASVDRRQMDHLERAAGTAAADVSAEIAAITMRLAQTELADAAFARWITDVVDRDRWREWPLAERVRFVTRACTICLRNRSSWSRDLYPGLAAIFRTTLTTDLHPGVAAGMYDHLHTLRWIVADDPSELAGFGPEVADPMVRHAAAWAAGLALAPRRPSGAAPRRIGYLGHNSRLSRGDAVARVIVSLLKGHARLASGRFDFTYYAWRTPDDEFRRSLEELGVVVRVVDWPSAPCGSIAALRGTIAADGIDALITDHNLGVPTVLFTARSAPLQIFLDLGFSAWGRGLADYTFLGFAGDPDRLELAADRYERMEYRIDRAFLSGPVDAGAVAAQRARFGGARHVFGFVGRLVKLSPDYFEALRTILGRVPDAAMYLGGIGDAAAVEAALSTFGDARRRVVFDHSVVDGGLMVQALDTFLDTFPFFGGVSCLEAQMAGRPVVYLNDARPGCRRFQEVMRDGALGASSVEQFAAHACRLAREPEVWGFHSREAARVAERGSDIVSNAAQIENAVERLLHQARRA